MNVLLIFRSNKLGFHSIENVFGAIKNELSTKCNLKTFCVNEMGFSFSNILAIRKRVKVLAADTIFHVTGDIHYSVFALPRTRTILTIHDCVFINKRKGLKGWILKKLYLDWPVWYVSSITTISEKTKKEVVALTGCNPDKIRVINNPVGSHISYYKKEFDQDNPVLLFIGSQPNKNLNRVIQALSGFRCMLNIIGQIDEFQRANLDRNNIRYVVENNLSNEEMNERYKEADIILFPSLYEGFGLPVLEGFKAGRAVLTSEISPMKEISDGAAWLVDPYRPDSIRNTLEKILKDSDLRLKKIQNGFHILQQYLPENIASLYHQAYQELDSRMAVAVAVD